MAVRNARSPEEQVQLDQLQAEVSHLDRRIEQLVSTQESSVEQERQRKQLLGRRQEVQEQLDALHRQLQKKYGIREGAIYPLEQI